MPARPSTAGPLGDPVRFAVRVVYAPAVDGAASGPPEPAADAPPPLPRSNRIATHCKICNDRVRAHAGVWMRILVPPRVRRVPYVVCARCAAQLTALLSSSPPPG